MSAGVPARAQAGPGDTLRRLARSEWLWLLLITLLALALRLYRLGEWSLWGDEVSNIRDSLRVFELNLPRRSVSRILSLAVMETWGVDAWRARIAPALLGVVTIPALYLPLRAAAGRRVALLALLFLAVSPWHLYWSQNARFYTGALLFYTLALLAFYFFLERDRFRYLAAAGLFLALAAQEHLTALILVPVAAAYMLLVWLGPWPTPPGLRKRNLLLLGLPGAAIALFMALPFVANPRVMVDLFGTPNNSPLWLAGGALYYVGFAFVLAATAGFLLGWRERSRLALLFGLSAALPVLTVSAIALFQYTANRYVFVSLTGWLVLAAFAVDRLARRPLPRPRRLAAWAPAVLLGGLLVATALGENALYYQYQNGNRENWRAALEWVAAHKGPADEVWAADERVGRFYLGPATGNLRDIVLPPTPAPGTTSWYIVDMNLPFSRPDVVAWLEEEATLEASFDVQFRARVFVMRVYSYRAPQEARLFSTVDS